MINIDLLQSQMVSIDQSKARFEEHPPFLTLMTMCIGPLFTSLSATVMDFVELYFLTSRFTGEEDPIQIQGFGRFCESLILLFMTYFSYIISTRLGRLLGENRKQDAMQFFTDVTKISALIIIFSLPFLQFLIIPLLNFMNCPENIINHCYLITIITFSSSPFILLFNLSCSFLQSVGHSILNGVIHILQLVFQVLFLAPLLLFFVKISINFISLPYSISQSLIGIILFVSIFTKKFGYDANFSTYALPVMDVTRLTLKNALSSAVGYVCNITPPVFIMKFLLQAGKSVGMVDGLSAVQSLFTKVANLSTSVSSSISIGLLTAGTFAFGAHDNRRLLKYFGYAILVTVLFNSAFSFVMIYEPTLISSIYLDSKTDVELSKRILKMPFYTNWFSSIVVMARTLQICIGKPFKAVVLFVLQLFNLIFVSYIISQIYPNDPLKIYLTYNINDIVLLLFTVILSSGTIHQLIKDMKNDENTYYLIDENNGYDFGYEK